MFFRKLKPLPLTQMAFDDIHARIDKLADDLDTLNRTDAVVAHLETIGDARLRAEAKRELEIRNILVRLKWLESASHVHGPEVPKRRKKRARKKKS